MLPIYSGGHATYQDTFVSDFLSLYPNPLVLPKATWAIIIDFWHLDLSQSDAMLSEYYSKFGPTPRQPSCMLRSYLLSIKLKITSITKWVQFLKENPLYAILSGFPSDNVPGIGTFYDFFSRLWQSHSNHLSPKERYKKVKVKKGKKTGDKTPFDTNSTCSKLLPFLVRNTIQPKHAFSLIFRLYEKQFLNVSIESGLISPEKLSLAGDGSPVRTSARPRSHRTCNCREQGINDCTCKRIYSQPDCNIGWDSSRDCYFNGYHLYMFVASDSKNDLPVFPLLERGSRHDMLSFLHTFFSMKSYLPEFRIEKLLLDAAHDAYPIYDYCRKEGITPFIDINKGNSGNFKYKNDFTIDNDGVPICSAGLRMHRDGYEKAKHRSKYRCPKMSPTKGCTCGSPCSDSKYGRTVHLASKDNPRLFNIPARNSKSWKKEYDRRTSVERSNKREKNDYKLEDGKHRSSKMWYCRLYGIMMLQHLDAWETPPIVAFQELLLSYAS